jgi:hypothetical protein
MPWLLDTNILSEGRKLRPEPRVTAFYVKQPRDTSEFDKARVPVFNPWE